MASNIYILGVMIMLLSVPALAVDSRGVGQNINTLPWEIIAEKFDTKKPFCTAKNKDRKIINFAFSPDAQMFTLPSNIKIPQKQTEAELNLSVWQGNKWADLPPIAVQIAPNGLTVDSNAIAKGFYNLSIVFDKNDVGKENIFHAVVASDWKKDLLSWCRNNKEQIETNPDPQLVYSSIAVSHFDNLMELTSESQFLVENILSALSKSIKAKTDFEDGKCPDFVIGLNRIRLKRFEGAPITEFVIRLPETYDNSKKWPMLVHTDPRRIWVGRYHRKMNNIITMWWHFLISSGYEWKDYKSFLDIINDKINLDNDRIYINGQCGNGISAIDLALKHPDQWAECSSSLGNALRQLAGNALNLPLIFVKGRHNEDRLVSYYNFAIECFKYHGCRFFKHSKLLSIARVRGGSIPTETRDLSPYRVSYTIESLANPSSYWLQIDGREDENFIASIDAIVWGQSILVKTDNVDAYTLNLEQAPLDCNRPIAIIENNKYLDSVTGPVVIIKSPRYESSIHIKNKSLHGPVSDVFTDRYAVVWKGDESTQRLAKQLAGSGPCFADAKLPTDFINTHNIIFVGRLDRSEHLSQISDKLPIIIEDGRLTANDQVYEGDFGAIFVYPNPLNMERYLAILTGSTDKAEGLLDNAWGQMKSKDNADIGIFKVSENNLIDWLICEKFNTIWDWHESWDAPLTKLTRTYPKWKWQQWGARILREQLDADIMILEKSFASAELPDTGELTFRDITRVFANNWIVKIQLKGKQLKKILFPSFIDTSSRAAFSLTVDGVYFKQSAPNLTEDSLQINEIESDKTYSVALSYQLVNGKRLGIVLKDYKILDDGYILSLLRDYINQNDNLDIEQQLESLKFNMF